MRISARFRVALAGKGLLLLSLGVVFAALLQRGALEADGHVLARAASLLIFGVPALFLAWTAALAFADALAGRAVVVSGAVALPRSRATGVSFRLPDRRTAEFLLYNPGPALMPGARYTVVIGRWSRVLVAPPSAE